MKRVISRTWIALCVTDFGVLILGRNLRVLCRVELLIHVVTGETRKSLGTYYIMVNRYILVMMKLSFKACIYFVCIGHVYLNL